MRKAIGIFLISFLFCGQANADSWAVQQQQTNEITNQRDELLRQQEELGRLKRENKDYEQELLRQNTQQDKAINTLKQQNDEILRQRQSDSWSQQIEQLERERESKKLQEEHGQQEESQRLKADNAKAADESDIVLSNDYYAQNIQTLLGKGYTASEARKLNDLHKSFVYRIAKSAAKDDAQAQFMLGMIYFYGKPYLYSPERIAEMKKRTQRGAVDLSWENQKQTIIEAVDTSLEQGSDLAYVALAEPKLPILPQDIDKAMALLGKAAKQGHKGALEMTNSIGSALIDDLKKEKR